MALLSLSLPPLSLSLSLSLYSFFVAEIAYLGIFSRSDD